MPLGDPWALVEQRGDRAQRREIDRHASWPSARSSATARSNAGPQPARRRTPASGCRSAARRGRCAGPGALSLYASPSSLPRSTREHPRRVGDGQREDRDAIEAAARRHDAARADEPRRRLQPDDVVEARRHAARAGGVGAERERHVAARDRDGRSRARAAADALGVERVRPRRTASACRRGRSRTGRGWSCRRRRRRPRSAAHGGACGGGDVANAGHAAVVGRPATSMLSFTANGTPKSGIVVGARPRSRSARRALRAHRSGARCRDGRPVRSTRRRASVSRRRRRAAISSRGEHRAPMRRSSRPS